MTRRMFGLVLAIGTLAVAPARSEQVWTGTVSDSRCGASHQAVASNGGVSNRECIFECVKELNAYVLVVNGDRVLPIINQDLAGLPLYAGRPVQITGELKGDAILATKIEAIAAHLHLGHVMTNWRETPRNVGFLIAAISDATVAVTHAKLALAAQPDDLATMKLHTGHVVNALDPSVEPNGPASGYGVKRATAGALQHLELAVKSEGSTDNIRLHAEHVSASLRNVVKWVDQALAAAQEIRSTSSSAEAAKRVTELVASTTAINEGLDANHDGQIGWQTGEGGLQQARVHMGLLMKGEGLENAPR